jgi:hypothetical protein
MAEQTSLKLDDVAYRRFKGHVLLIVTAAPADRMSLLYRGNDWSVEYAVARLARLGSGKSGALWYTADQAASLEHLETFRRDPRATP